MTDHWQSHSQQKWNELAEYWNQSSESMWDNGSRKDIIPFIKQYINKGSTICDLGCGDGYGSYLLAKNGYRVIGLDFAEEMIVNANQRVKGDDLSFLQGSLDATPFKDRQFDATIAINSIEWNESPLKALLEMRRIIKVGGHAFVAILGPTAAPRMNSYDRLYSKPAVCHTIMPWEFEQLAKENGWEIITGLPVYKMEVEAEFANKLPKLLQMANSFMWVFMMKKIGKQGVKHV